MSIYVRSIYLLTLVFFLSAMAACAGDDDNGDEADAGLNGDHDSSTADNSSLMSAEALQEWYDLGLDEFLGKAVVKEETTEGNVTTYVFDSASGPICLRGSDFTVFVRDMGSDNMLFFLSGGGACWTGMPWCYEEAPLSEIPGGMYRVMDENNDENVAKDWNVVFVSYCDGSVFWGENEVDEPDGTIRYHHGRQNLSAGMDLALKHFPDMKRILLFGSSAGGYGTFFATPLMRMAYPQAELFVVADSGLGLQDTEKTGDIDIRLEEWRYPIPPSCVSCDGGRGQSTEIYTWLLENDTGLTVSMASYDQDLVIGGLYLSLTGPAYKTLLLEETDKIRASFPERYKRFLVSGSNHVVGLDFNDAQIEDVTYAQWVRAMIEGDDTIWRDLVEEPLEPGGTGDTTSESVPEGDECAIVMGLEVATTKIPVGEAIGVCQKSSDPCLSGTSDDIDITAVLSEQQLAVFGITDVSQVSQLITKSPVQANCASGLMCCVKPDQCANVGAQMMGLPIFGASIESVQCVDKGSCSDEVQREMDVGCPEGQTCCVATVP